MQYYLCGIKIWTEKCSFSQDRMETRFVSFPNGATYKITLSRRVWGWYDIFFAGYPKREFKYLLKFLKYTKTGAKIKNIPIEDDISRELNLLLLQLNRVRFERDKKYIS